MRHCFWYVLTLIQRQRPLFSQLKLVVMDEKSILECMLEKTTLGAHRISKKINDPKIYLNFIFICKVYNNPTK